MDHGVIETSVAVNEGVLGCSKKRGTPVVPISNLKLRRVVKARIEEAADPAPKRAPDRRDPPPKRRRGPRTQHAAPSEGPTASDVIAAHISAGGSSSAKEADPCDVDATKAEVVPADAERAPSVQRRPPTILSAPSPHAGASAGLFNIRRKQSFLGRAAAGPGPGPGPPPSPASGPPRAPTPPQPGGAPDPGARAASPTPRSAPEPPSFWDDHDGADTDAADLTPLLTKHFGFPGFRAGQESVVRRILQGRSTLAVLPTGTGKSLCYQLAILALARARPKARGAFALVVSPLISLMADQLRHLPRCLNGIALTAGQTGHSLEQTVQAIKKGDVQLLFVSPERLVRNTHFMAQLQRVRDRLAFVCLDEAHCVSEWGHNYRTSYLHVAQVSRLLVLLGLRQMDCGRAVLKNPHFFFVKDSLQGQPPGTTNRQPPTANRQSPTADRQPPTANRQPPTTVQYCFCGFVSCPCLDHETESVPVNVRFCGRYEPFFLFPSGQPWTVVMKLFAHRNAAHESENRCVDPSEGPFAAVCQPPFRAFAVRAGVGGVPRHPPGV